MRRFTGWHMTAILVVFFGVVVSVNFTMATFATRTFGGKVVENSYVASQRFNGWLAEARAQDALGWTHEAAIGADRRMTFSVAAAGKPLGGATITGFARHPVGLEADVPLRFVSAGPGRWESDAPLPAGRWYAHLTVTSGPDEARLIEDVQ